MKGDLHVVLVNLHTGGEGESQREGDLQVAFSGNLHTGVQGESQGQSEGDLHLVLIICSGSERGSEGGQDEGG